MLEDIKNLLTGSLETFAKNPNDITSVTRQLVDIENTYDVLSSDRFTNSPDYQRKQQNMLTTLSGKHKILYVVSRFKV